MLLPLLLLLQAGLQVANYANKGEVNGPVMGTSGAGGSRYARLRQVGQGRAEGGLGGQRRAGQGRVVRGGAVEGRGIVHMYKFPHTDTSITPIPTHSPTIHPALDILH